MAEQELETVRQIENNSGVHDIEAPKLVPENDYIVGKLSINKNGDAIIELNKNSLASGGIIKYNSKGNISVESLSKHVNLEAAKAIQLKPTTNVIFDSSRRIKNDKGNEVHLQFVFDDYDSEATGQYSGDDEEYAELKVEARNIDLRCFDHGGIALQPCGTDNGNKENKIKFESSRTSALSESNPTYSNEGGKGLEFGTFNNDHTSLFTKDYRFNKDGLVYAVTRGTPTLSQNGKFDYPTQTDDFKDIVPNLGVTWNSIVKTAAVFDMFYKGGDFSAEELLHCFREVFVEEA